MNAPVPALTVDPRYQAKLLYWQGWRVASIARKLDQPAATVHSWKARDDWDSTPEVQRVEASITARLVQLAAKPDKTDGELREIDTLTRAMQRTARVRKFDQGGNEGDLNPRVRERARQGRRKQEQKKNYLNPEQVESLVNAFRAGLFDYQKHWHAAGLKHRIRNILKSRQIGATWYFAREALVDLITTGRDQIFLSASKAQAQVFKLYILDFVEEVTGVQLKGDPLTIKTDAFNATARFLGTNARTVQSYHGCVYMDEYFWIPRFAEFRKVASGMAMHKKWRLTYISTPSTVGHEAYPFWTGEHYNRGRKKADHIHLDVSHAALARGRTCEDGQWRQVVTVEDAVAGGCDLFDLEQLRLEYNEREWDNLLMCEFVDDSQSVWPLKKLERCMVDALERWPDWRPFATRPVGDRAVWIGYDPSRVRDGAAVDVVLPPSVEGGKYRVVETFLWFGMPFPQQAEELRRLVTERYHAEHLEIDCTGPGGLTVLELVQAFFPQARKVIYSPQVKTVMVAKAMNIIDNGRLEYDSGKKDLTAALMAIKQTSTEKTGQVTYTSARNEETGHADLAWALLHALDASHITAGGDAGADSIMEIF